MPDHPGAHGGYLLEHRYVMEQVLGRPLERTEHVHHIDGDRANNAPSNLIVLTASQHAQHHHAGKTMSIDARLRMSTTKRLKRFCKRGHEFSDANTRIAPQGYRVCKECHRLREYALNHGLAMSS
jgi:hypothetical protein